MLWIILLLLPTFAFWLGPESGQKAEVLKILLPNAERDLKITFISDTHGLHHKLEISDDTDILIHAGDFTNDGKGVQNFASWFVKQKARHKVIISGNHDVFMDPNYEPANVTSIREDLLKTFKNNGIVYLEDSSTEIEGIKIYGTPWTALYTHKAFQIVEEQLNEKFRNIPDGLDVLISHSPPKGILDGPANAGSQSLANIVREKKPRIHVFGHIHAGHLQMKDQSEKNGTYFMNAAIKAKNRIGFKSADSIEEVHVFDKELPPNTHFSQTETKQAEIRFQENPHDVNTATDPTNKPIVIVVKSQNNLKKQSNKATQSLFFAVVCLFFVIY